MKSSPAFGRKPSVTFPALADSQRPATLEDMRASSESTSLVPVDPRRRIVCSVRESLVTLHGALIIAEQQTYERLSGPVPSIDVLIDLLQKDPWFTWLHPIADLLVRMDHLLDDDTCDITDENVAHLMREYIKGQVSRIHRGLNDKQRESN